MLCLQTLFITVNPAACINGRDFYRKLCILLNRLCRSLLGHWLIKSWGLFFRWITDSGDASNILSSLFAVLFCSCYAFLFTQKLILFLGQFYFNCDFSGCKFWSVQCIMYISFSRDFFFLMYNIPWKHIHREFLFLMKWQKLNTKMPLVFN